MKCQICKNEIPNRPRRTKYCSDECAYQATRKRQQYVEGKKAPYMAWLKLRFEIFKRDNFQCQYCGRSAKNNCVLIIDHIKPLNKEGSNKADNLITSCEECNYGKSDVLLSQREIERLIRLTE